MDSQITVHSIPEPGEVRINGVLRGKTPLMLSYPDKTVFKLVVSLESGSSAEIDYTVAGEGTIILDLASGNQVDMAAYKKYLGSKVVQDSNPPAEIAPATAPEPTKVPIIIEEPTAIPPTEPPPTEVPTDIPEIEYPEATDKVKVDRPPEILQPPKLTAIPLDIQNLNLKGTVEFKLLIDAEGIVTKVVLVKSSGNDKVDQFILPFIEKSLWNPAVKAGVAIGCWRKLSISFYTLACKFDFIDLY